MAVPEQTPYKEYTANGVTTSFPLEFDCDNQDHLIVTVNDIEPENGQWSFINGAVVFLIAPANQAKIIIQRNTPLERNTDYQTYNNSFRPQPVNKDFDRIWWKLQELGHRDQLIWLALVKEIADRIAGDKNLQNQINAIDNWLEDLQQNVNENTSDIAQLVNDLSKEIADRITNDLILKDMFLTIIDTAINEGTVNALAITYVDSLDELNVISNVWNGRTVCVTGIGNYKYSSSIDTWSRDFITDRQVVTVNNVAELQTLQKWDGRTAYIENIGNFKWSTSKNIWVKDEPYNVYDFKTEQPLQYYYNLSGSWDDAIHQAQLNMYTKGYSYTMLLPRGDITINKPIFGCAALGMYMHSLYPELKIYDEQTNTFKLNPPLVIKGHGRDSSKIIFAGGKGRGTPDDKTFLNYGAIHTAPFDVLGQCSGSATKFYHQNAWTRLKLDGFTLWGYNPETNGDRPNAHGIVAFRGNRAFITDVSVECFNGAGMLFDGFYDSFCKDFEIFQCGRMSPKYGEYLTKNLTDIKYQTYAPLHIMRSSIGDGWDNCNFLRFNGFHIEDCYNAVADIIISGDSSPIWIDDVHIESENGEGISKLEKKALIGIGGYGVSRFAQDGVDNYNYGSEEFTGNGGGYAIWRGGACYSWTYGQGILMKSYTQLSINNFSVPNYVNVSINAGNTSAKFEAVNSRFGNIINNGNDAQISLTDCDISSYSQNYGKCPKMINVKINGELNIDNNLSSPNEPLILNKVTCTKATGIVNFGNVDLFISGNEPSNLYVYVGTYNVFENYIQNNLGAI
ncbi:hypothetical protein N5J44_10370 [Acinetobacter ursingii]|uniref:hypothetical protein n=1 Tax=Acinetobacter ursingii TaxID=108980 RepID=UPI00244B8A0E|nr:hypothetical protein [Acinetobacter ursingii]MDH2019168.1 hypothetical protein [Acinetobacter ursingii]MDH2071938.1 hypothetical protein [Acinetobacter ursingii]